MILLPAENKILADVVNRQFDIPAGSDDEKNVQREAIDVKMCDFDDTTYHVFTPADDLNFLCVSMAAPCFRDIEHRGALAAFKKHYANMLENTEDGFNITLKIDLNTMKREDVVSKVALLKSNVIGGAFDYYFDPLLNGNTVPEQSFFRLRSDTLVYLIPKNDRITVVFGLDFHDKVDLAVARVFMQEFTLVRNRVGAAPPCGFSQTAPLELQAAGFANEQSNILGYISFAVMKSHLEHGRKDKVISVLHSFRSFFQYHLKSSKAYFHSRMRARVISLLKVLNRAKAEVPSDKKEMKTSSGKTFVRS